MMFFCTSDVPPPIVSITVYRYVDSERPAMGASSVFTRSWVPGPPMTDEALAGARLVLNISASPYQAGKGRQREQMIAQRARDSLAAVAFCGDHAISGVVPAR